MERYQRKTPLDVLKSMWVAIREASGEELEHTRLVKHLLKIFTNAGDIESYVSNAVVDGLIQIVEKPKKPKPKSVYHYTLPDISNYSFPDEHPDVYCYECHLEGNVLKCAGCLRVFHRGCVRSSTDKQLELERFTSKYKRVNISAFGISDGVNREIRSVSPSAATTPDLTVTNSSEADANKNHVISVNLDISKKMVKSELDPSGVKQEDFKEELLVDEPHFVGVIRLPDRRLEERLNTPTVKPEDRGNSIMDSDEFIHRYCFPCRQVHGNQYNTPPNLSQAELNYLLKFVIDQYKSWLPDDTYSPTKLFNNRSRVSEVVDNMELCKALLLRSSVTLDVIEQKIDNSSYTTLEEFSGDIQDIAHNIAIIHGANSLEYNAVMYFVTDCIYDLYEIRQCPDCFRHSNEKAEPDWFARPCVTRHELVFAKQKGYQYWPAKVIRVYNNRYDVRFFGDQHSRAVIDATSVKPIDTDFEVLKINPKQRGFQKAIDELHKHQALISLPKDYYAFGSQVLTPIDVLLQASNLGTLYAASSQVVTTPAKKRGRKPKAQAFGTSVTSSREHGLNNGMFQISVQLESSTTPNNRSANATQNETDTRSTRQKEKRLTEPVNNENSPSIPKRIRPNFDIVPLNEPGSSAMTTKKPNERNPKESSAPSDESLKPRSPRIKAQLKRQYSDDVIKLKALMDEMNDIEKVKHLAVNALQEDINRWQQKIRVLVAEYNTRIAEVKHKQWCNSCEHESILHCCWNTSYCSRECQERDWSDHKKQHKFARQ
ncbi:zinc finger MYND domain-containing protein 11 [Topomyia yanbarensis]|uniref:zinc finger MYND domain-containing protein 11 n=1 Tax=Topomyia yanbarensis TaxID=2498891 RepID=UPI00273CC773|nr:zinc finger MYND domain-containing protein 11 [Topomyia yanbarensis]